MDYKNNILETVGKTPLVKINKMALGCKATILAKVESFNPGGSVKDRIGIYMVNDAIKRGVLKPGGTIIESTSGNTGVGLAIAAAVMGYKCIFTMPDKMSQEKVDLLKAYGAEVITTPTAVAPEDPRSYYSVAKKLSEEIPNSFYTDQFFNSVNPLTHYEMTGPEIWEQTDGKLTHFVAGLGTGGTMSGVGKYLKEKNPAIKTIGVDPIGSLYFNFFHNDNNGQAHSYLVEGIGEDMLPDTMEFEYIDDVIKVSDQDSFTVARELTELEGIFSGGSCGSALWVALQIAKDLDETAVVVVLLPDSGSRYLSKQYNTSWMNEHQMLKNSIDITAGKIAAKKSGNVPMELIQITPDTNVADAVASMRQHSISQMPVMEEGQMIGSLREGDLVDMLISNPEASQGIVRKIMSPPFHVVAKDARIDELARLINQDNPAVVIKHRDGTYDIITKQDLVSAII